MVLIKSERECKKYIKEKKKGIKAVIYNKSDVWCIHFRDDSKTIRSILLLKVGVENGKNLLNVTLGISKCMKGSETIHTRSNEFEHSDLAHA